MYITKVTCTKRAKTKGRKNAVYIICWLLLIFYFVLYVCVVLQKPVHNLETFTVVARRLWLVYTWDNANSLLISDIILPNWFRPRGMLSYHISALGCLEGRWNKNTHLGFSFLQNVIICYHQSNMHKTCENKKKRKCSIHHLLAPTYLLFCIICVCCFAKTCS
jgi:hypothetical protein